MVNTRTASSLPRGWSASGVSDQPACLASEVAPIGQLLLQRVQQILLLTKAENRQALFRCVYMLGENKNHRNKRHHCTRGQWNDCKWSCSVDFLGPGPGSVPAVRSLEVETRIATRKLNNVKHRSACSSCPKKSATIYSSQSCRFACVELVRGACAATVTYRTRTRRCTPRVQTLIPNGSHKT